MPSATARLEHRGGIDWDDAGVVADEEDGRVNANSNAGRWTRRWREAVASASSVKLVFEHRADSRPRQAEHDRRAGDRGDDALHHHAAGARVNEACTGACVPRDQSTRATTQRVQIFPVIVYPPSHLSICRRALVAGNRLTASNDKVPFTRSLRRPLPCNSRTCPRGSPGAAEPANRSSVTTRSRVVARWR